MSASESQIVKSSTSSMPHLHAVGETCPTCDQLIPHDRFEEIKEKIHARQSSHAREVTARLQEQFKREKTDALEQAGREAAATLVAQVAIARSEERKAADALASLKLADAERASKEAQAAMQLRVDHAEAARIASEKSGNDLRAELDQAQRDKEAAIQKLTQEARSREVAIRADAAKQADAAVQEKIARVEQSHQESVATFQARIKEADDLKAAAQKFSAELQNQLNQMRADAEAEIEKARQDADVRVHAAREEATAAVQAAAQEKIDAAEHARAEAEAKAALAEEEKRVQQDSHNVQLEQRLQEQREAYEIAQTTAVNAEKSAAFERELRLQTKVADLQRTLDNKTAEELGEGAEIDLYEVLKGEFDGDRIERVNKGQPGADILHTVIHNGKECGTIIYDSKNHNGWRDSFVTKLASDQMAAKADHAILSTRKFPAGKRHLHVQDGVILAAPSRVAALVQIVRQHIVQTYSLRLSDESRTQKTAALYAFINSERCRDLFKRIDGQAEKLLDLQLKEKKAHETIWKTQGELIRSVQKVQAEISNEIDSIIGTSDMFEQSLI